MVYPLPLSRQQNPVAGQILRPDSDVSVGGWEGQDDATTNLHDYVNDSSDATYLRPQVPGLEECPTTENDGFEVGLEDPTEEPTGGVDTVVMRVRARYSMPIGGTGSATARFRLREGATTRATDAGNALTTSFADYDLVLSQAEIDAITDWTALRVFADADVCVDTLGDEISFEVSEIELRINQ